MKSLTIIQYIILGILLVSLFQSYPSFPPEFVKDRDSFIKINQLSDEIANLQSPAFKKITNVDQEKIYSKIDQIINLNDNIDPRYFDFFNSEFKYYFQEKNIKGIKVFYEGLKEIDSGISVKKQIEGSSLREEWFNWWQNNRKVMTDQAFPPNKRSPVVSIMIFFALWIISMFISPFTILSALIILRFGIPVTKKLNKLNLLKQNNAIIRNYWISLFILSTIFIAVHYFLAKIFGLTFSFCLLVGLSMILPSIGKIGVNKENVEDYVQVNKDNFTTSEIEVVSAIFSK